MLIYSAIMSLDGYTTDPEGNFEWGAPDEEVFAFLNGLERPIGTYLYGRQMYEVMLAWENVNLAEPVGRSAGLRRDMAIGRQDRLLHVAERAIDGQDSDRARLRS